MTEINSEDLKKWINEGSLPSNLDQSSLVQIEKIIQQIRENNATAEDVLLLLANGNKNSLEEIEKGLKFYKFINENKNSIIWNEKSKPTKFRQAGHLTDQTLKYKEQQLTFFDLLTPETKEKISDAKIEIKTEGIRLTPSEDRLVKALSKLVHEKCINLVMSNPDYSVSTPDSNFQLSSYGGNEQKARAPTLRISPAELYKAYLDRDKYSGEEIKFIKKLLEELSQKKFLIQYDRKRQVKGKTVTDRIEDVQSLIKIMSYIEGLSDSELKKLNEGDTQIREKKGELIIGLNPIFLDQINTKYIEYPSDISKRTAIAAGGHLCVTESIIVLRDYMLREISAKRFRSEINEENLPYILRLDGYIKRRKKKQIEEKTSNAIQAVMNLGIIQGFEKVTGANGQQKYVFTLNNEFE
jgi:hypothetical protein